MGSNETTSYLEVPPQRALQVKSSLQVLEPHSAPKTLKLNKKDYLDSNESGSIQMNKPRLVHNLSGPERSKKSSQSM